MKFVFASDSFKGTLSSSKIIELLTIAARESFPDCETVGIPVSSGSIGTIDAVAQALAGERRSITVHNPHMEEVQASYCIYHLPGKESELGAVIEMSSASGVHLLPGDQLNPLYTTTYGTGELILDALNNGCSEISIAIGASATNDGGIGAMRALGAKFFDEDGNELGLKDDSHTYYGGVGKDLENIASIDLSGLSPLLKNTSITVLSNVDNPLTGPDGAVFTYGKQKCSPDIEPDDLNDILSTLEAGMLNYSRVLAATFGTDPDEIPGGGAAGGLGAALHLFLGAEMGLGIETILSLLDLDSQLENADLCITGEGRLDWQSAHGKTVSGVAAHCRKHNVPLAAIVGDTGEGFEDAYDIGVSVIIRTCCDMPLEKAMMNAEEYYLLTARAYFQSLKML